MKPPTQRREDPDRNDASADVIEAAVSAFPHLADEIFAHEFGYFENVACVSCAGQNISTPLSHLSTLLVADETQVLLTLCGVVTVSSTTSYISWTQCSVQL